MARSPFTLVAAVTAALPGAEVTGARALSAGGDGRFDSAIATLSDGRELVIRVAEDDEASVELAEEALALRALTTGAREMLPFTAPSYIGETRVGDARALVTDLLPGFQIDAADVPPGRGAAESMGAATAAVHTLPTSVVRGAGLAVRDAAAVREELRHVVDRAASTGRVPARLTVRWREAVDDDELWRFETTVTLGGVEAGSFLFHDDPDLGPQVTGVIDWKGLSVGDPATDLAWLSSAPDAADDVHGAYMRTADRGTDDALRVRARLHAELEFARWLLHGEALHRDDIVDDAAALLESLADGVRQDLSVPMAARTDVESAMDALDRVPGAEAAPVDTAMQTDAYRPEELWVDADLDDAGPEGEEPPAADATDEVDDVSDGAVAEATGSGDAAGNHREVRAAASAPAHDPDATAPVTADATEDLSDITGVRGSHGTARTPRGTGPVRTESGESTEEPPLDDSDEAQRAARAALQRWTNSGSE